MNILIDMIHPADTSFYKETINRLQQKKHHITITVLKRGILPRLVKQEYPNTNIILLGTHKKKLLGKILGIIQRETELIKLYKKHHYDLVTSFGFYPGIAAKLFGIRSVHIHDDKEYRLNYALTKTFCDRFISLCPTKQTKKTRYVKTYKELAYLHPKNLAEDKKILKRLQLKNYVYLRDISAISLNYSQSSNDFSNIITTLTKKGYQVVYHPEDENKTYKEAINIKGILKRDELTALINNAQALITNGDTVLRESALLGTPTIFVGTRHMSINEELHREGLWIMSSMEQLEQNLNKILQKNRKKQLQQKAHKHIAKLSDINTIMEEELGI